MGRFAVCAPFHDREAVLVVTPKVASVSIITAILEHLDARPTPNFHDAEAVGWMEAGDVLRQIPHYRRAIFVRNPFDRMAGNWEHHIRGGGYRASKNLVALGFHAEMPFADFVARVCADTSADPHFAVQSKQLGGEAFVGKLESMARDWDAFRDWLGIDLPDLPHVNRSARLHDHYRDYYDAESASRVAEAYEADMEAYRYGF